MDYLQKNNFEGNMKQYLLDKLREEPLGVFCGDRILVKLKDKLHHTTVKLILYIVQNIRQ